MNNSLLSKEFKDLITKKILDANGDQYGNISEEDISNFLNSIQGESCMYYLLNELSLTKY